MPSSNRGKRPQRHCPHCDNRIGNGAATVLVRRGKTRIPAHKDCDDQKQAERKK